MDTSKTRPTIAVFGGSANTGFEFITLALEAGYQINALARNPLKLNAYRARYPAGWSNLHIIKGDILEPEDVAECLVRDNRVVDIVVSTVGIRPNGLKGFAGQNTSTCELGLKCILETVEQIESETGIENSTKIIVLSTTGISDFGRDIPIALIPLWKSPMMTTPHRDKKRMEAVLAATSDARKWVAVRPSLLIDGESKGLESLRVSSEGVLGPDGNVTVGYVIRRADVALWIFLELVDCPKGNWKFWERKRVTLTY